MIDKMLRLKGIILQAGYRGFADFSSKSGITYNKIFYEFKRKEKPSEVLIAQLCKALECCPSEILLNTEELSQWKSQNKDLPLNEKDEELLMKAILFVDQIMCENELDKSKVNDLKVESYTSIFKQLKNIEYYSESSS